MGNTLKYGIVTVLSLPVAVFFAADVALCFGEKNLPFDDQIILASFVGAWAFLIYWAPRVPSVREAAARTCLAFTTAALLLPVASIVFMVTEVPVQDPIFPASFIVLACFFFGGIMGFLGWVAFQVLSP